MKLNLFFACIFLIANCLSIFSQNVSTAIQKKSILLEEFTGIHCGFCPDGHVMARNLLNANENAYVIAIHSNHFAIPIGNEPDYRISEGEIIDNEFDVGFYPSGCINRHTFDYDLVLGRGQWAKSAKTIQEEEAPVNLLLTGTFDGDNRKLSVKVEGYYTLDVTETSHWLNVVVTQSNIIGFQGGTGGDANYVHNRMLRCFITPMNEEVWGEEIEMPAQGEYFEFVYDFDLPDNVKNILIKPEDIEIIAFVCAGKQEVLNVTGIKPDYVNYEKPLQATLQTPVREIGTRYGYNFFEAQLKNLSNQTVTSAKFEITINGETQEVDWTGEITAFQTKSVIIKVEPYTINANNQYDIKLIALNNENFEGNTISGSFNAPIETTEKVLIEIKTDLYADENRFLIRDIDGNIVEEFGPYQANLAAIYNESITLEKNKTYCFEVEDKWWDGMLQPRGSFKLRNDDEDLIVQNYEIKLWGDRVFIHTSKESSSTNYDKIKDDTFIICYNNLQQTIDVSFMPIVTETVDISLYSIAGTRLTNMSIGVEEGINCEISFPVSKYGKGIYLLKIKEKNNSTTLKLIKK